MFRADSGWQNFITERAVADISREFRDYPISPPRRDVYETATKPHLWLITERGLDADFPAALVRRLDTPIGGIEVTIPWADLAPLSQSRRAHAHPPRGLDAPATQRGSRRARAACAQCANQRP